MSETTHNAGDDIHVTHADVTVTPGPGVWYESKAYKSLLALVAIIRWIVVAFVFIMGAYIYQRDTNAQTGMSVADIARETKSLRDLIDERKRERDAQFNDLKQTTVSTAVFNAQFDNINKRLDRIEAALDRIQPRQ